MKSLIFGLIVFVGILGAEAAIRIDFTGVNLEIPDGDPSGVSDTQQVIVPVSSIQRLAVFLSIDGGFNGDLFAYLVHDSGYSVLLNRVGKTAENPWGYWDAGFDVTFQSGQPDIHSYRLTLSGDSSLAINGELGGVWDVDGRETDPALVEVGDSRTALLESFVGIDPNGTWSLFLADLDSGGRSRLVSWGLEFQVPSVPESGWMNLGAALACILAIFAKGFAKKTRVMR